jgi:hypothetical protein
MQSNHGQNGYLIPCLASLSPIWPVTWDWDQYTIES